MTRYEALAKEAGILPVDPRHRKDTEQDRQSLIRVQDGRLYIEVMHCVHCERLTIGPTTDECTCGAECYPVTKSVPLGVPQKVAEMKGG